ncbi:hypothetical protein J437_LFUL013643 [Ladona fulva]|uniref:Craniofacial development protein 2-like n=1 Tax=Ladona fulva TaxID=123851 RepID=A0A8K0KI54_LADFU|nr:hypothetical protein J437_LFUL013643 [Ladona fulva]
MNGKSREIVHLMSRRKVNILCILETRWKGNKAKELAEGYRHGRTNEKGRNEVGVIIDKELKVGIYEVERMSDRIMCVKLEIGRGSTTIVCGYAPQAGCEEEEMNVFWRQLDQVIMEIPENERVNVGADLNGHVGRRRCGEERAHGRWGVGERNGEGERIMEHAVAYDLTIVNTCFRKGEGHLITYKSGDRVSQIDYILCRRKYLQEMRNCKVINGESVMRQHRLVVADCYIKADTKVKHKN